MLRAAVFTNRPTTVISVASWPTGADQSDVESCPGPAAASCSPVRPSATNPAVQLTIAEGDHRFNPWLFVDFPGIIDIPESKYAFEIAGYLPSKYTGLQMGRNPGITIVWTGCLMIVVGMALSSSIFHRRLWVNIQPQGTKTVLHFGGNTHKGNIDFTREFSAFTERIKGMA